MQQMSSPKTMVNMDEYSFYYYNANSNTEHRKNCNEDGFVLTTKILKAIENVENGVLWGR